MERLLEQLRATAEPTRLRILALCTYADLTVSDLVAILGQSQPRLSRHLKLLTEAGLLARYKEGQWAYYRPPSGVQGGRLAQLLIGLIPPDDPHHRLDRERLAVIERDRHKAAGAYFSANARKWNRIRSLYVDEADVERALLELFEGEAIQSLLDIGTGTGRMLSLFSDRVESAIGIDINREMLMVARDTLQSEGLRHCHVRHGDMYRLPWSGGFFDGAVLHQVLHFAEAPDAAIREAARVLRPGGLLAIVDFAPHAVEAIAKEQAHRWLGFEEEAMSGWCRSAELEIERLHKLPGKPLTVTLWLARRRGRTAPQGKRKAA
jgi:ArsR family transcriptional regulator